MSPQAKVHLGAQAEAMLASWPAPSTDDAAWENRAAKIVAAATNASRAEDAQLSALFAKPALDPEPGEVESSNVSAVVARSVSGEKAMTQDSNSGSSGKPSSASIAPTSGAVSKRPSLKELAARASQANAAGAPSMRPSTSVPPPAADAVSQDKQARPSSPMQSVPPPKASVPPRAIEASKEDSGRFDLNAITQAAAPAQVAVAEVAKPAAPVLVEAAVGEDKPAAANDASEGAKVKSISDARAKKAKKKNEAAKTNDVVKAAEALPVVETAKKAESESGGGGAKWGVILAVLGLAAGGFVRRRNLWQRSFKKNPKRLRSLSINKRSPKNRNLLRRVCRSTRFRRLNLPSLRKHRQQRKLPLLRQRKPRRRLHPRPKLLHRRLCRRLQRPRANPVICRARWPKPSVVPRTNPSTPTMPRPQRVVREVKISRSNLRKVRCPQRCVPLRPVQRPVWPAQTTFHMPT